MGILDRYRREQAIVLDPFCGRGTTIYAAREMGFSTWGIDSSPIAVAIAKAKLASAEVEDVITLARRLVQREPTTIPQTLFFRKAFHRHTLKQLCSLREGLLNLRQETHASILLRAAALGCLHGPLNKTSPSYFSNQMPRTFAAKPDYAVKYWKDKNLKAPRVDVIEVLKKKLSRITRLNETCTNTPGQILNMDSRHVAAFQQVPNNFSLVITSPPYLGMNTYIADQWLRMWLLGGDEVVTYEERMQMRHHSQQSFVESLAQVWSNLYQSESADLDLFVRFGTLPSTGCDPKKIMSESLEHAGGWRTIYTKSAKTASNGKRQARLMANESKPQDEFDFHITRR